MDIKLEYRNTVESDYEEMVKWWNYWRFPPPIRKFLPDDFSSGMMVSYNGQNVCSGFIYSTSAKALFHCEFIVSNFEVRDKEVRAKALAFLISGLKYMAIQMGAEIIYTSLVNDNLINKFLDSGYIKGSKGSTEMVYLKS